MATDFAGPQFPSSYFARLTPVQSFLPMLDTPVLKRATAALLFALLLLPASVAAQYKPLGLQLTWQQDPTTTMTIDWHELADRSSRGLDYRRRGGTSWSSAPVSQHTFPHSDRLIYRSELTGLEPGSPYEFRLGEDGHVFSFRTMPETISQPIRFAVGGDVRHRQEWMDRTNRVAASHDPDFVVFGGDLAYADGDPRRVYRWYEWFESTMNTLVTPSGRQIPVVAGIGNHEIWFDTRAGTGPEAADFIQHYDLENGRPTFFFDLFPFPGAPGYSVLDFGEYMSLIVLDTDHASPILGAQTSWLENVLKQREGRPHLFPVYHQPAYPSVRPMSETSSTRIRNHWSPLFERYGVRVAFESHDHAYKRTHPIRAGRIDPAGVIYLGDGAWGVETREIGSRQEEYAWYIDRAVSVRHFILVTLQGAHQHFSTIDEEGNVLDEYPARTDLSMAERTTGVLSIFPNPASSSASITFDLRAPQRTGIFVYDTLGRHVRTIRDHTLLSQGPHVISFNVDSLGPGTYLVRVEGRDEMLVRRLTVLP